ncbi:MAG: diguanylate cyclase, partial [Lachnospiraceae bacterium]|nr:diguanylate cyclase [Lachnospiraceae bacterium]
QILLDLVNEVLALGRSERGMVTMRHDPLEIIGFFNSCGSIIKGLTMDAGINFTKEVGLVLHPNVLGDELHLRQILLNIVDNSIKFTREGGLITLRLNEEISSEAGSEKAVYIFEIEDTGTGMSKQYLKNMFDSFANVEDAMSAGNGLGIGMSITKKYVELMGGTIDVESELQVGTRFTIRIPMDIYRAPKQNENDEKVKQLEGARILLAEDNELNMEIARKMLIEEGATVTSAENGLIALSLYRSSEEGSFDAILMDVAMPMLDGIAAAKEIRASTRYDARTLPIIAMVASNTDEDINMLLDAGMSDYISKPVDVTQLVRTLLAAMKRQSSELAERLEKALRDANTDALTGVKNRNAYELSTGRINVEIESSNEPVEFMIVICDVNGLKSINDNIGHDEGNKLLVNACRLICRTFKRSPVFRIGGDEFVAILRNDDYQNRATLVGGLMERMTAENYDPTDVNNVSFAIGAADFDPALDNNCADVFKRADAVMYEHKKSIKGEGNIR